MMTFVIEMFGLPAKIAACPQIEVKLNPGAGLKDLVKALREVKPELAGPVILAGQDRLVNSCGFNINGRFFYGSQEYQLKKGDRIVLLTVASGG